MLLVNLSREKIILQGNAVEKHLPYIDIERKLPALLIKVIEEYDMQEIAVCNGPGSFTTLRLGCLILNTIKQYGDREITLYTYSKLDLYTKAYESGLLPKIGYVFIGQKKNMWRCTKHEGGNTELENVHRGWGCDVVSYETLSLPQEGDYFIDPCDHMLLEYMDDECMLKQSFDGEKVIVTYTGNTLDIVIKDIAQQVDVLEPQYFIEPQIG